MGLGHKISHQPPIPGAHLTVDDHCPRHPLDPRQLSFDLSEFDPISTNFHLLVAAAEIFEVSILHPATHVSGPVEPCARPTAKRIGDELLGGEFRLPEIPQCQPVTPDQEFPRHADSHQPQAVVDDVASRVRQGPADRYVAAMKSIVGVDGVHARKRGRFGRPVAIAEAYSGQIDQGPADMSD